MSASRLFAERFLVPLRDEASEPDSSAYDERRSVTLAGDGTPVVEGPHAPWGGTVTDIKEPARSDQD
jgi:hypothetical protein